MDQEKTAPNISIPADHPPDGFQQPKIVKRRKASSK